MSHPKDFNELVSWAAWEVVEGMTGGKPLRSVMHGVLQGALNIMEEWKKARTVAPSLDVETLLAAERERLCAAIKAEDDHCVTEGDYMLDSDDCISIIRGTWKRPDYSPSPKGAALKGQPEPLQPRSRGDESAAPEHPSRRSTHEGKPDAAGTS